MDKLKELIKDNAFVQELLNNKTAEEAKAFLESHGVEATLDEVKALGRKLASAFDKAKDELSESELAGVAGGEGLDLDAVADDIKRGDYGDAANKVWEWVTSW